MDNLLIDIALTLVCEYLVNGNARLTAKNSEDDVTWITMKGNHIPIKKGETKEEAIKKFISSKEKTSSSEKTQSKEFKKWFGKSKAVDKKGNPLVMYHGSKSSIRFRTFKDHEPIWFTSSLPYAKAFAENNNKPYEVYIKLENPIWVGDIDGRATEFAIERLSDKVNLSANELKKILTKNNGKYLYDITKSKDFKEIMKSRGYDGIEAWEGGGMTTYAVFSSNQIKSTKNKGNFDPESNNIYE